MARDISIAISARDNFSSAITSMKNANNSFKKDVTELQNKLDALNKNKITLKVETDKAKAALKDAEKAFKSLGNAAGEEHVRELQKANETYEQARRNLNLVGSQARATEKDILNLTGAISKSENRASSGGKGGLMSTLATAGVYKLVGDALTNIASGVATSAYGDVGSTIFSGILSGATSGAAVGTLLGGPGIGTAIGALAGSGLGLISGLTNLEKNRDDAFKNVVQSAFEDAIQSQSQSIISGSSIAGNRELKQISFATLLGSEEAAKDYLEQMTEFAATTPFEYDQLAEISKTLLAYGYKQDELIPLLTKVGDAGSALSLNAEDINNIAVSLGRMQITGQTNMRYLNPLLDKGIPVWDYLAKASGKTREEVQEMVSKGLVPGAEAAKAIADYMGAGFEGNMEKQSKTYEGLLSALEDAQNEIDNAMGEGYNEERKKGIKAQIDYFEGESGEKIKEANKMIGEWKASLDNAKEAAIRDAMDAMMDTEEYKDAAAEGNRVKMGALLMEAQIKGENEYKASEGYQLQLQADLELVKNIREDTNLKEEYWNTGYIMGQEFSKGRLAGMESTSDFGPSYPTSSYNRAWAYAMKENMGNKYAYGLNYVPYDNFPALLHQGERVLTASENRTHGNIPQVNITGNKFTVREEADIQKIGQVIVDNIIRELGVM